MKKKSKDPGHLIVANGDGTQRTGSGDGMDGIHCRFMLWGIKSAMARSLRKRAEGGIKERREGVQYRDEGEDQE